MISSRNVRYALLAVVMAFVSSCGDEGNDPGNAPSGQESASTPPPPETGPWSGPPPEIKPAVQVAPPIAPAFSDGPVRFVMHDGPTTASFTSEGLQILLGKPPSPARGKHAQGAARTDHNPSQAWGLRWSLDGAQPVEPVGDGLRSDPVNYLVGGDSAAWKSDLSTYERVVYAGIRPGIDLVVESRRHGFKYSLNVAPGIDLRSLRFRVEGAQGLQQVDSGTGIAIRTGLGTLRESGLVCYQPIGSSRCPVTACYTEIRQESDLAWSYGLELYGADPTLPLVIDPTLSWSGYLGGSQEDFASAVALDAAGNAYVCGTTGSSDFPFTVGPSFGGGAYDAFVMKVASSGAILWSTFLGGSQGDGSCGVRVDGQGNVIVVGNTTSTDFPRTIGAFQPVYGGGSGGDAFVAKLAPSGASLVWSSYLGGSGSDYSGAVTLDAGGDIYLAGTTSSANFPGAALGFDKVLGGQWDGFVCKIPSDGGLAWSSYVGGASDWDDAYGIAVDDLKNVYVAGYSDAGDFPTTTGVVDKNVDADGDGYVMKVKPDGTALLWSTFLGGSGYDAAYGIAVDAQKNVYVAGDSDSPNFPMKNAFQASLGDADGDAFITKLASDAKSLVWSSYFGGAGWDSGYTLALNPTGELYIVGDTASFDLPARERGFQPVHSPTVTDTWVTTADYDNFDAFVAKIAGSGLTPTLLWSSYIGGSGYDAALAVASDGPSVTLVGYSGGGFPVSGGADTSFGGAAYDGWIARVLESRVQLAPPQMKLYATPAIPQTAFKTATFWNVGSGAMPWAATSDASWLKTDLTGGSLLSGASGALKISANAAGLALGTYTGKVTVSDTQFGSARSISVTLFVTEILMSEAPGVPALGPSGTGQGQFMMNGTSALPIGGWTKESSVVFKGVASDDSSWQLEVEVKAVGAGFDGSGTRLSTPAPAGQSAVVTFPLGPGSYAWRARSINYNQQSAWACFGGNREGLAADPDFSVAAPGTTVPPNAPDSLDQFNLDGRSLVLSGTTTDSGIIAKARIVDIDGDDVALEIEVQGMDSDFTGVPSTSTGPFVHSGSTASVTISIFPGDPIVPPSSPLFGGAYHTYHWQARAVDVSGKRSGWVAFGANPDVPHVWTDHWGYPERVWEGDFSIPIPLVAPNSPPSAVNLAPAANAGQFLPGGAAIAVGATITGNAVVFKGIASDPNGDQWRLEVEVSTDPFNAAWFLATAMSDYVASGQTAAVTLTLPAGTYHWRARAVDAHQAFGSTSVAFGGNSDSTSPFDADFIVSAGPVPTSPITLSEQNIYFTATDGGPASPASQVVYLTNAGPAATTVSIKSTDPWAGPAPVTVPLGPGEQVYFFVSVDTTTLRSEGYVQYSSQVTVTDAAFPNAPRKIGVYVSVYANRLFVVPGSMVFTALQGEYGPPQQTATLMNYGWLPVTYSVRGNNSWLYAMTEAGSDFGVAYVTQTQADEYKSPIVMVNPYGKAPGTYVDYVTVTNQASPNQPRKICVTLIVKATGLRMSTAPLSFTAKAGGPVSAAQTVTLSNVGSDPLPLTVFWLSDEGYLPSWLKVNTDSWTLGANSSMPMAVSVDPAGKPAGTYTAQIKVWDTDYPNSANSTASLISVTMTVTAAANTAPVLLDKAVTLSAGKGSGAPAGAMGTPISALADLAVPAGGLDNVVDGDAGAVTGVAIIAADTTNGTWSFTIDGGATWLPLGNVAPATARLLATNSSTRIYFQPNPGYSGTTPAALTFRAWDQTSGANGALAITTVNGGATAFSGGVAPAGTDTASLTVSAVDGDLTIGSYENTGAAIGSNITIPVTWTSAAGSTYGVTGFDVSLYYDPAVLSFGSLAFGDFFTNSGQYTPVVTASEDLNYGSYARIRLAATLANDAKVVGSGALAQITFQVNKIGSSALSARKFSVRRDALGVFLGFDPETTVRVANPGVAGANIVNLASGVFSNETLRSVALHDLLVEYRFKGTDPATSTVKVQNLGEASVTLRFWDGTTEQAVGPLLPGVGKTFTYPAASFAVARVYLDPVLVYEPVTSNNETTYAARVLLGDVTSTVAGQRDGKVNTLDRAYVGARFNLSFGGPANANGQKYAAAADFNATGKIDTLDRTAVAAQFNQVLR